MAQSPLKVAWISSFPVEWLPGIPEPFREMPRQHPATWQRVLLDEYKGVPDLKLHIVSVRRQYPRNFTFELNGATFHCLRLPRGMRSLSLFWWETLLIKRCFKSVRPDVVHAWGSERGAALVASRLGYPYFISIQGLLEFYLQQVNLGAAVQLDAKLERLSLRRAQVVTGESTFSTNWVRTHHPHLQVHHIEHSPGWMFYKIERRPETKPLRFLFVGSLSPLKGVDLLLQALHTLAGELDFRLIVVGSLLPGFEGIKETASPALRPRITWRHTLTQAEVAEELARATLVLFPTRADTGPVAVKEAAVAGVPVVGSVMGGIPDYITPGKNGFLFPPGDLGAFIRAIREASVHPLFSQGRVEAAALAEAREKLSPRRMAEGFLGLYQRLGGN